MRSLMLTMFLLAAPAALAQGPVMALHTTDAHGRAFDLESLRGNVVAVTFTSRYTQDEAARVNDALGKEGSDVKVVSVVDFVGIPGFVHNYARKKMAEADGRVQHVCDEKGELRRQFGAHSQQHVDIFVVDRDGGLRGRFEGQQQLEAALRLIDEVRTSTAQR